jgi:hypothetical protein
LDRYLGDLTGVLTSCCGLDGWGIVTGVVLI